MSDQGNEHEENDMSAQPDERDHERDHERVRVGVETDTDADFRDRVLARMPEDAREEMRAHWAGRPMDERARDREQATEEDWALVHAARAERRAKVWRESLPTEFADARVSALYPAQHPDLLRKWWGSDHRILYLRSEVVGNGKTHAAYAIANQVCERVWCAAWTLADLLDTQIGRERDRDVWRTATRCDLLILDDVGQEISVGWEKEKAREILHRLLSDRAGRGKRTIITTNRKGSWIESDSKEDGGGYGAAVADRLQHQAVVIEFKGESLRQGVEWGDLG
jgi:hypothetical protein